MAEYNQGLVVGKILVNGREAKEDEAGVILQYIWSTSENKMMRTWVIRDDKPTADDKPAAWTAGNGNYALGFLWSPLEIASVVDPPKIRVTSFVTHGQANRGSYDGRMGLYVSMRAVADGTGIPNLKDKNSWITDIGPDVYNILRSLKADYPRYMKKLTRIPKVGITAMQPSPEYYALLAVANINLSA